MWDPKLISEESLGMPLLFNIFRIYRLLSEKSLKTMAMGLISLLGRSGAFVSKT